MKADEQTNEALGTMAATRTISVGGLKERVNDSAGREIAGREIEEEFYFSYMLSVPHVGSLEGCYRM